MGQGMSSSPIRSPLCEDLGMQIFYADQWTADGWSIRQNKVTTKRFAAPCCDACEESLFEVKHAVVAVTGGVCCV